MPLIVTDHLVGRTAKRSHRLQVYILPRELCRQNMSQPHHDPSDGYETHANSLDNPSQAEQQAENAPDVREKALNKFDTHRLSLGGTELDAEVDLSSADAPGRPSGVGLSSGPDETITMDELRRRARAERTRYPPEIEAKIAAAQERIDEGASPDELEPLDLTSATHR